MYFGESEELNFRVFITSVITSDVVAVSEEFLLLRRNGTEAPISFEMFAILGQSVDTITL
jgi:hypothetical protein